MTENNMMSLIDSYLAINVEKIAYKGEDSYLYRIEPEAVIAGVFDGCGGSGAQTYDEIGGKTGAYISSRSAANATADWFDFSVHENNGRFAVDRLRKRIDEGLSICNGVCGNQSGITGTLVRKFPTTAAITLCRKQANGMSVTCIWCGDSRCYVLDSRGLKQLTKDDVDGYDAMQNISSDGVLTNVISLSRNYELHTKALQLTGPCIVFTATDGCFGYLSTPMEFEYYLLDTMLSSDKIEQWENKLKKVFNRYSGDDYSLCGYVVGYGDYQTMKNHFMTRKKYLYDNYIKNLTSLSHEHKVSLWMKYKQSYEKYL